MSHVYIAGPVIGREEVKRDIYGSYGRQVEQTHVERRDLDDLYRWITYGAENVGWHTDLPRSTPELEHASPSEFYRRISGRIDQADAVITALGHGDVSAAGESTIGAVRGKPQLVFLLDGQPAPRIIEGLPGVAAVLAIHNEQQVIFDVSRFLSAPEPPTSGGWRWLRT